MMKPIHIINSHLRSKNLHHLLGVVLTLCILLVGCQHEEGTVFTVLTQQYGSTKDYIDNDIVYWSTGDSMYINNNIYTVTVDPGNHNRASVNADDVTPSSGTYYAAHPSRYCNIAGSTVNFTLPQVEKYELKESKQHIKNLMVAAVSADAADKILQFQNVCAMLHFSVKSTSDGAKLCAIEVSCDKPLWGAMQATYNGSSWSITPPSTVGNTTRRLAFDTPQTLTSVPQDFYLQVPPVSGITTFTLRYIFENANGTVKSFDLTRSPASINFSQSTLYNFPTDEYDGDQVSNTNITVTTNSMDGTASNPYEVFSTKSWKTMMKLAADNSSKYFSLQSDITIDTTFSTFSATLNGNNHTVTLSNPDNSIFKEINSGKVQDLIIGTGTASNPTFYKPASINYYGFLACSTYNSTITNCTNNASVTCTSTNTTLYIGGICGRADNTSITFCHNTGALTGNGSNIGGIAGYVNNCTGFSHNTNAGAITLSGEPKSSSICGGVAGTVNLSDNSYTIVECYNEGAITIAITTTPSADDAIGGVFGIVNCNLEDCGNKGTGTINNTNTLTQLIYFGGLLGKNQNTSKHTIRNCYNEGTISATSSTKMRVGGLVGSIQNMDILNCYASCNIDAYIAGGLVGYAPSSLGTDCIMSNCYYYGVITATSGTRGLSNIETITTNKQQIDHCYCPKDYTMWNANGSIDGGGNGTLASGKTLTGGSSLSDTLNAVIPTGGHSWLEVSNHVILNH